MKNLTSVKIQISNLNGRIEVLQERSYNPEISASELRELDKRRKKLLKTRKKLEKKLDICRTHTNRIKGN